jgi:hypothetical protein
LFLGSVVEVEVPPFEDASVVVVVAEFGAAGLVERSMRYVAPTKSSRMIITTPKAG